MSNEVNHLFDGFIEEYELSIDEKREESYSESEGSCSYTKTYHLHSINPISISEARALFTIWLKAAGRTRFHGYPIVSFNLSHADENDLDRLWDIELTYEGKAEDELDYEKYKVQYELQEQFSTGGGTAHITDCWSNDGGGETVYPVSGVSNYPTTFNGRIGWNGESCDGVDVIRPAFSFSLHKKVAAEDMTTSYRQTLCLLTGSVNNDTYCGFSAGNLLLESVSGTSSAEYFEEDIQIDSITGDITWEPRVFYDLTFQFKGGMTFTNFDVSGATVAEKKAHQYVWVYTQKSDDSTVGVTLETPICAVVNDVYPEADFTQLNIYGEQDNQQGA